METQRDELTRAVQFAIQQAITQLNGNSIPKISELMKLLELQKELQREEVKFVTATWIEPEN